MTNETKLVIGVGIATLLILFGAVFFFSKPEVAPTEAPRADNALLLQNAKNVVKGDGTVILVEFADFQCPACGAAHSVVKQALEKYKGKITYAYRHFPLPQHKNALLAARAAESAKKLGGEAKFWEMHNLLFVRQSQWEESGKANDEFVRYAKEIGLDTEAFATLLDSKEFDESISQDQRDGERLGVNSTPSFFLNGQKLTLRSYGDLLKVIEEQVK